jgi:hypothetical protein
MPSFSWQRLAAKDARALRASEDNSALLEEGSLGFIEAELRDAYSIR